MGVHIKSSESIAGDGILSRNRRISLVDSEKDLKNIRGPHGYRLCRFCGTEVQPPRKTFCSELCIFEWKIRSSTSFARDHIYERDLGKCALCQVDTRYQKIKIEDMLKHVQGNEKHPDYQNLIRSLRLTAKEAKRSLWQADHIVPVAYGGGACGLEGFQSLCVMCHKHKSGRQMTDKAESKKRPKKIQVKKMSKIVDSEDDKVRGFPGFPGISRKVNDEEEL